MKKDWPETPHRQELIYRLSADKDLVVTFVTADRIERAVWDNRYYYETFRYGTEAGWTADTIEDAEVWPADMAELYSEACLYLGELEEQGKPMD